MKLDRNINSDGGGKYALVHMRKLRAILEGSPHNMNTQAVSHAVELLIDQGVVSLGDESPEDQFFVMKYKDKFTPDGLRGYAESVARELKKPLDPHVRRHLVEYAEEMFSQAHQARQTGSRIPD